MWAPTFSADKVAERADLVAEKPIKFRADTLAWRLRLTMEERTRLKITSIGAIDVPKEDRPEWLREHHRQAQGSRTPGQRRQAARRVPGELDQVPRSHGRRWACPEGHLVSPGQARRKTEMGSIHGPETDGMPHPVSPISKAGGSEALAKPFQGENLTKGTPSAHHPAARERSQPKATDPKTKEKLYQAVSTAPSWPSVPIVPRAFDPTAPPDWVLRLRDFAAAMEAGRFGVLSLPRSPSWRLATYTRNPLANA